MLTLHFFHQSIWKHCIIDMQILTIHLKWFVQPLYNWYWKSAVSHNCSLDWWLIKIGCLPLMNTERHTLWKTSIEASRHCFDYSRKHFSPYKTPGNYYIGERFVVCFSMISCNNQFHWMQKLVIKHLVGQFIYLTSETNMNDWNNTIYNHCRTS
jgi:hypothetical protein